MKQNNEADEAKDEKITQFIEELRQIINDNNFEELESILSNITEDNLSEVVNRIKSFNIQDEKIAYAISLVIIDAFHVSSSKHKLLSDLVSELGDEFINKFAKCLNLEVTKRKDPLYEIFPDLIQEKIEEPTQKQFFKRGFRQFGLGFHAVPALAVLQPNKVEMFDQIVDFIKKDDVDSMRQMISSPNLNFNINHRYLFKFNEQNEDYNLNELSCLYGSIKCFRFLIQNTENSTIRKCMDYAIIGGNHEIIQILEQSGINVDTNSIQIAIQYHKIEIFDWLLEKFDAKYEKYRLMNFFSACIRHRFYHGLKLINECDAFDVFREATISNFSLVIDLCIKYFIQSFPDGFMHVAINYKNYQVIKKLLDCELMPQKEKELSKYFSVLMKEKLLNALLSSQELIIGNVINIACKDPNYGIIKKLAKHKNTDLNNVYNNHTPLSYACMTDNKYVVEFLLSYPAVDVNGTNVGNPLALAASRGYDEIVKMLLDDPRTNVNGRKGSNPLNKAILNAMDGSYSYYHIIDLLFEHPDIDVNPEGEDNCLSNAVNKNTINDVKILLDHHKINPNGNNSPHPLYLACKNASKEIFDLLIAHDDIDPNGKKENCPLIEIIKLRPEFKDVGIQMALSLLEHPKIDVNGFEGENPLTKAIEENNSDIFEMLINHPAIDVNGKGSDVPLFSAIKNNNKKYLDKLLLNPNIDLFIEVEDTNAVILAKQKSKEIFNMIITHPKFDQEEFLKIHPQLIDYFEKDG